MSKLHWFVLISRLSTNVAEDSEVYVFRVVIKLEFGSNVRIALSASRTLVSELLQLFRCVPSVVFYVLQHMRADGVKLFVNNGSHLSHVVVAPADLVSVIIRQGLSQDDLHLADDIL